MVGKPGGPRFSFTAALAKRVHSHSTRLLMSCGGNGKRANMLLKMGTHPLFRKRNGKGKVTFALVPRGPVITFREFRFGRGRG